MVSGRNNTQCYDACKRTETWRVKKHDCGWCLWKKKKKLLTHKRGWVIYPTNKLISLIITHPHTNSHAISFNKSLLLIFPCILQQGSSQEISIRVSIPNGLTACPAYMIHSTSHSQKTLPGSVLTWVHIYNIPCPHTLKKLRFGLFSSIPTYGPLILNEFWRFDTTKQQGVHDKMCGNQEGLIELRDKRILSYSPCPYYSDYNSWTPCLTLTV